MVNNWPGHNITKITTHFFVFISPLFTLFAQPKWPRHNSCLLPWLFTAAVAAAQNAFRCLPFFFAASCALPSIFYFFFFVVGRAASLNGLQPVMFVRMLRFWEMHALLRCCDGVRAFVVFVSAWKFACQRLCNVNLTNTPNAREQWKRDYATGTERDQQHTTTATTTKF